MTDEVTGMYSVSYCCAILQIDRVDSVRNIANMVFWQLAAACWQLLTHNTHILVADYLVKYDVPVLQELPYLPLHITTPYPE
jgi:hypothetical protein